MTTLITGGAGFIGTNMANRLLRRGERVVVLDDLSRAGVAENLRWLRDTHRDRLRVEVGDVCDSATVRQSLAGCDRVFHFAAQVAVTTSVDDPMHDFQVNLGGTMSLLEEVRRLDSPPTVLFTSTNKVYGNLVDVGLEKRGERYEPADPDLRTSGIGEARPLHFCSPYGCSKGGADQYVLDYSASYDLPTVVFRMSCIYGPHQCGNEDQGWVAHFLMRALANEAVTLYGDGCQVRDVLFVEDLLDAMLLATEGIDRLQGRAFNMGGGPDNTVSLLELLAMIGELTGRDPAVEFGEWRVGDQRYYVSDTRSFSEATGWTPQVRPADGVARLYRWLKQNPVGMALSEAV
jgi:CDP-paratose 2-epimerase